MSGYPRTLAARGDTRAEPAHAFPVPVTYRYSLCPLMGGWSNATPGAGLSRNDGSTPSYVYASLSGVTVVHPFVSRYDLTNTPADGDLVLSELAVDYYRAGASDALELRLMRRALSGGAVSTVQTWSEGSHFTTTGAWATFSTALALDLETSAYVYWWELDITPNGSTTNARIGDVLLSVKHLGVEPGLG